MAFLNFIWKSKCTSQKNFEKKEIAIKDGFPIRYQYLRSIYSYE